MMCSNERMLTFVNFCNILLHLGLVLLSLDEPAGAAARLVRHAKTANKTCSGGVCAEPATRLNVEYQAKNKFAASCQLARSP